MRVPFRSREQRRGKHSEGSESDYEGEPHRHADRDLPGSSELSEISGLAQSQDLDEPADATADDSPFVEEWHIEAPAPAVAQEVEMDPIPDPTPKFETLSPAPETGGHSVVSAGPDGSPDTLKEPATAPASAFAGRDSLRATTVVSENGAGGALKRGLGPVGAMASVERSETDAKEATEGSSESDATAETEESVGPVLENRPSIKLPRVVAVANQKGGVGKTTTAVNLGAGLAELGFRVLVIDLDPQGNATTGLGIEARNFENSMYDVIMKDVALEDCIEPTSLRNLFVAPATIDLAGAEIELVPAFSREFKLRKAIQTVVDDFDYVLIDCPPSLGLITINGLAAADEVLVPIQCEYYALEGLGQLLRNVQLVQSNLNEKLEVSTIVLTMYDARTKLADQVASEVRAHFGPRVCRVVIPRTVRISEAPSFGQPITVFDPTSRGAIAYRELAKEVSGVET